MNLSELEKTLLAAARENPPDDRVPYAFSKRVTARLSSLPAPDRWALWSGALWRGAASCLALMVLLSVGSYFVPLDRNSGGDLSQDFENTMLAAADQEADLVW